MCSGRVVNLAARAVRAADPDEVLAPAAVAIDAGSPHEPLGPRPLKGLDGQVELARIVDQPPDASL
jgi:class 3 adenylate cyclase